MSPLGWAGHEMARPGGLEPPTVGYALRPPVAIDRLQRTEDGRVRLSVRHPWPDGTTELTFSPVGLLERLAGPGRRPRTGLLFTSQRP